jgi:phage-related protein
MGDEDDDAVRPLHWIGSSKADLTSFPEQARKDMGYALYLAQCGEKSANAKPLRGFGGASVLEIVAKQRGNTFRGVYCVKFAEVVYVLHCFQKKSTKGAATSISDINLIKQRLGAAAVHYRQRYGKEQS